MAESLTDKQIDELRESLPDGPYFVNFDDGSDCPNHANSGLAVVDTGRTEDWPIARHCHWPVAKMIAALPALLATLDEKDRICTGLNALDNARKAEVNSLRVELQQARERIAELTAARDKAKGTKAGTPPSPRDSVVEGSNSS